MCRQAILPDWRKGREGETEVEGKIESRSTRLGFRPGLHVGWRGTRPGGRGAAWEPKAHNQNGLASASPATLRWSWRCGSL